MVYISVECKWTINVLFVFLLPFHIHIIKSCLDFGEKVRKMRCKQAFIIHLPIRGLIKYSLELLLK